MKITKGKRAGVVVQLGEKDTKLWESHSEAGYKFRARVRDEMREFARKHKIRGSIEIYAAKSKGGWVADVERIF